jgi:hypothetical protein
LFFLSGQHLYFFKVTKSPANPPYNIALEAGGKYEGVSITGVLEFETDKLSP